MTMLRRLTSLLLTGLLVASALRAQQASETFTPGDAIRLAVEGDSVLSGTFTVGPGPALTLPVIGDVSLAGVRRADLEPHLREYLSRFLRNPVVHAKALIRLLIVGEVAKPGIYAVPTDLVLADALMLAGGPTPGAKVTAIRIERGGRRLVEGDRMQAALAQGMSVDYLNLRPGDRIEVPRGRDPGSTLRILSIAGGSLMTIYGILRFAR
jgi:protein involved in polysaccharide export with SLBB domain